MASLFLNCREAHALLSRQRDERLGFGERLTLRIHLLGCDGCERVGRSLALLARSVRELERHFDGS